MRRYLFAAIVAVLALVAAVALSAWYFERPTVVRVAVARDTPDLQLMTAVAAVMSRERETLRLRIIPVENASASAAAIDDDSTDFAVVRTDIDMPKQGQTVAILHRSAVVILAPGGSGITQIADLKGRNIGVLTNRSGGEANARLVDVLLAHYDASEGARKLTLTADEIPQALADRRIDALIAIGDPATDQLNDALSAVAAAGHGPPEFVPVLEGTALAQRSPVFEPVEVPRGAFGGASPRPSRDIQTIGVSTRLVARARVSDGTVGEMVRILFATRPLIAASSPLANRMEAPSTDKGATLPVHPGAVAYLDGEEETFLEKYSDFIYIGAMVVSVLASAAAALASRLTAANHARSEELMELLLEHLGAAREAPTSTRLDELEREADTVLGQALEAGSLRHLDTHRVTALGLAIDQVRLAIRDRRRQIEGGAPAETRESPRILAG